MKTFVTVLALLLSSVSGAQTEETQLSLQYENNGSQVVITNDGAMIDDEFVSWGESADRRLVFVKKWEKGTETVENCVVVTKRVGVTTVAVNKYWKNEAKFCPNYVLFTKSVWAGVTFIPVVDAKKAKRIEPNDIDAIKSLVRRLANGAAIEDFNRDN